MDKFTKTTEIDISAMNEIEDETPKKSNAGTIVALILCLVASIFIWLLVMETDTQEIEKTFSGVPVQVVQVSDIDSYEITVSSATVTVKATKSDMADLTKDGIKLTLTVLKYTELDLNSTEPQTITLLPEDVKIFGNDDGEWKMVGSVKVTVQVKAK